MVDNIPVHVDPARPAAPTLEQVAERAGVSRSTASRAINGGLRVSPEALASVEAAVADLGYTPNRAARSLVTKRTDSIALVVPEPDERVLSDPFFAGTLNGLSTSLADSDMQVVLVIARPGESERTVRYLRNGHVDGAIVVSHHANDELDRALQLSRVPNVFVGRPLSADERDVQYVDTDNVEGGRLATQHLIDRGCRRIAHDRRSGGHVRRHRPAHRLAQRDRRRRDVRRRGRARRLHDGVRARSRRASCSRGSPTSTRIFIASDLMAAGALERAGRAGQGGPRGHRRRRVRQPRCRGVDHSPADQRHPARRRDGARRRCPPARPAQRRACRRRR